jgi:uncharacterized coiled-coil protein SlyX
VSLSSILSLVSIIVAVLTVMGLAGGSFRVSRNTQTVANYREAALSWEAKADAQEKDIELLRAALIEKDRQIAELQGRVVVLQDMVTAAPAIEHLATTMADVVTRMDTRGAEVLAQIGQLRGEVRGLAETAAAREAEHG